MPAPMMAMRGRERNAFVISSTREVEGLLASRTSRRAPVCETSTRRPSNHLSLGCHGTAIADRGDFKGEEILACEAAGAAPIVPKPLTSEAKTPAKERRVKRWEHEAVLDAMH
jgi:hypothetical protein